MKRTRFEERGKLVVYLEEKDLQRLTKHARENGRVVGEYVRHLILEHLEPGLASARSIRQSNGATVDARPQEQTRGKVTESTIPSGNVHSLDEPVYKSHRKNCACFLCDAARSAGLM